MYPLDILSNLGEDKPWRIAHVKSRREKSLAGCLAQAGIGYCLPMYRSRQSSGKRQRFSLLPLFPGYLFFKADEFDRHKALRTHHVARIIEVRDPATLVTELSSVYKALEGGGEVYPSQFLNVGEFVRIKSGPLRDVEGIIVRKDRHYRLIISITSIMQSMSVEVDADMVERISIRKQSNRF
jgi:transcription antitermination factor NusG